MGQERAPFPRRCQGHAQAGGGSGAGPAQAVRARRWADATAGSVAGGGPPRVPHRPTGATPPAAGRLVAGRPGHIVTARSRSRLRVGCNVTSGAVTVRDRPVGNEVSRISHTVSSRGRGEGRG